MTVTENQLDGWVRGNSRDAQGVIVEFVYRLVAASCPKPRERRFPLGDSIGQHGEDGFLDTQLPFEPFVPEGRSAWEISTELKASKKATSDYKDRTNAVAENVRAEATFVFVTPYSGRRGWKHSSKQDAQTDWLDKRRSMREWKDVRIIDGTKLIDWVHQFPAVELWLVEKITGISQGQIEIPTQHWSIVSSIGQPPPLTPDLFLVSRSEACAKLKEIFDGTTIRLKLATHYPDQVVDFVSAYLTSLDVESHADAVGRCLIVSGINEWNTICSASQWKNHILIADASLDLSGDTGTKLIQKARNAGHAVIFGGPHGGIPDPASVPLPTPHIHQIQEALEKAGYGQERARALAQKSGGNLSSLLRCLQNLSVLPEWAERSDAAELAIAALLGSWSDNLDADRAAVENLSGKVYGEWIRVVREIALRPATPLIQRDGDWKFISRYEGWYALGPRLFDEHLDRLKAAAISVLREIDPQFELSTEQRHAAGMYGKVLSHSRILRSGLAETLALLGSHPEALTSCSHGRAETTAVLAVREILADADWVQWASVNDLLPLLAEAAPGEFLDMVERELQKALCPFDEIFAQEGDGIFGGNYMTGLLWALETLAWDSDYLIRAVICLGKLAARDPGGRWANRPANSLTTLFLPWLPQTCAPVSKRVVAVGTLLTELPDIGWKLLISLLPQYHSASSGTRRPAWRETIPDDWQQGVTYREYREQVSAYAELVITEAKQDVSKLAELIYLLENLPPPAHEHLLGHLGSDTVMALPETDKLLLWNKLVDLVTKHRKFPDAQWAMKPEQVDKIAALADRLAPNEPFFRHQRLFGENDFDLFGEKDNYEEQGKNLQKRRLMAMEEIADNGGIEAVLGFAKVVQSPWRVGIAYGFVANPDADAMVLPRLLESETKPLAQFAGGFVRGRFHNRGWEWVDGIETSNWVPRQIGQLFSFLPFTRDAWRRVKMLLGTDQSAYWSQTTANPYEAKTDLEPAIDQLIACGRPYAAIRCLHKSLQEKQSFNKRKKRLAVRALIEALSSSENPTSMDVYEIGEVIKALQNDKDTNSDDLFRVEWAYLPLLAAHHDASPRLLSRRLADDPRFFCEVIRLVYRSKNEVPPAEEVSEERKNIATNAYHLLREWRIPPGLAEGGAYDGNALKVWLELVKKECTETGHWNVAMITVGHVLIYVPADPSGLWIHRSAAEVLNAKDALEIRDGFRTELYNSRGVHWIDPTGKPEKELAAKYRIQAEAVENAGYHRLATTLRELVESYEREAESVSSSHQFDV